MFHFVNNDTESKNECKKLIKKSFILSSSTKNKDFLFKTDFKCAWLYLFGYKISKVNSRINQILYIYHLY